jgi:type IV pilus assembly protein PilZ
VDLLVRVDYKTVDELFSEFARNINEGGLFVETEQPPPLGDPIALQFCIPGAGEPVQATGFVVRVSDGSGHEPPGMGIQFDKLDDQAQELINELVRSLRARPSADGAPAETS